MNAGEGFSVAFDPLDGSSVVDTNFSVGTIFGVWPGDKLTGITGRDQVNLRTRLNLRTQQNPRMQCQCQCQYGDECDRALVKAAMQ